MSKYQGGMIGSLSNTPSGTAYTGKANGMWSLPSHITLKTSSLWAAGQTKPNAPSIGTASLVSSTSASVAFIPPPQDGGSTITIYTVTSSGGHVATGTSSPIIVTGLTSGSNYTFTVTATNSVGTSAASSASASLLLVAGSAYYYQTILLLTGDDLLDHSSDVKTITNTGSVSVNTSTKKFGTGSMYFSGTSTSAMSTMLSTGSSANFNIATGDFTIEMWFYATQLQNYSRLINFNSTWGPDSVCINWNSSSSNLVFSIYNYANPMLSTTSPPSMNTWNHVAVTRSGNLFSLFLNGTLQQSASWSGSMFGTTTPYITIGNGDVSVGGFSPFTGYIDDVRIIKGAAIYTVSFTPPVSAITSTPPSYDPYWYNTSLLLTGSDMIDHSSSAKTLTTYGNTVVNTSTVKYGTGSIYFDGSGDYFTVQVSNSFQFGTGNFTVECWIYQLSPYNSWPFILDFGEHISGPGFAWVVGGGVGSDAPTPNNMSFYSQGWVSSNLDLSTANTWIHIAAVRFNSTLYFFKNGQMSAAYAYTKDLTLSTSNIGIGGCINGTYALQTNRNFKGYMSDLRITKGVARYTASFTPPTSSLPVIESPQDPFWYNTSLLVTGEDLLDHSSVPKTITNNSVAVNTTTKKYGTSSLYFNGTSACMTLASSSVFAFGTGDFTVEYWIYYTSASTAYGHCVLDTRTANGNATGIAFSTMNNGAAEIYTSTEKANAGTANINAWNHYAFVRSNGILSGYINGVSVFAIALAQDFSDTTCVIGSNNPRNTWLTGYVDDLRITKGVARYTAAFVPPAQALPTTG